MSDPTTTTRGKRCRVAHNDQIPDWTRASDFRHLPLNYWGLAGRVLARIV